MNRPAFTPASIRVVCALGAVISIPGLPNPVLADAPVPAQATQSTAAAAPAAAPAIDETAMSLLKKVGTTMLALKTYKAECWTTVSYPEGADGKTRPVSYSMATLTAARPTFERYDSWSMTSDGHGGLTKKNVTPEYTFVCNGKNYWKQFGDTYHTDKRMALGTIGTILEPWTGFYSVDWSPYSSVDGYRTGGGTLIEVRRDGKETVDGAVCDKIFVHYKVDFGGTTQEYWTTWSIGADTLVRRRVDTIAFSDRPGYTRDATVRAIKTNAPVTTDSGLFTYAPPKGVKKGDDFGAPPKAQPPLLANGVAAPDFTATDKDGKAVTLSSLKGKVVVVDFWASWCPPCKASMPHNQEIAKKLQTEGVPVVVLAVDNGEDHNAFAEWVKAHPELSALQFAYVDPKKLELSGKTYQVSGIPTQYVIDPAGVIRASFVGFGGPTDDLENAIRAALKEK